MNKGNITKAAYQADIKRKQAFFNRCARRCKVAKTVGDLTRIFCALALLFHQAVEPFDVVISQIVIGQRAIVIGENV